MSTETPRPVHAGFRMKPPGKAGCPLLTLLTLLTCYQSYHELHLIPSTESIGVFDEESIGLAIHAQQRVGGCSWFGMQLGSTQPPCLNNSDLGIEISAGDSRWLRWAHSKKMTFLKCWGQVMTALPHSSNLRWFKVFKGRTKACWAIFRSLASHWLSIRFTFLKINPRCSQHTNGLSRSSLSRKIAPLRPTTSHLTLNPYGHLMDIWWTSDGHLMDICAQLHGPEKTPRSV